MRFPSQAGAIAGVSIRVTDHARAMPFWLGVLRPLGFGRLSVRPDLIFWARDGAQILMWQGSPPSSGFRMLLRAPSREVVDALYRQALAEGWRVIAPAAEGFYAPGYYSCILADPDGIRVELVHAWSELPERDDAERVRIPGADGVTLAGYLFRPAREISGERSLPGVIVISGYGGDATDLGWFGQELTKSGFIVLCLSQRGWLGSTGDEDQGFRQPDDLVAVANWFRSHARDVSLLGFSQGGQVALLAAARPSATPFRSVVAYYPCADLAAWRDQTAEPGVAEYLADFVPPERMAVCSPITVARQIRCPTLLVHGDADTNTLIAQSQAMVEANPEIRLQTVPGAEHSFRLDQWPEVWSETVSFLAQNS
jgi:dienelactone hydrolase